MLQARVVPPIYVGSGIWQEVGWGSIIYLAALSAIDPELYEAAVIDGAGRWRQTLNITLPGIAPTIMIMLILRMGRMMNVGVGEDHPALQPDHLRDGRRDLDVRLPQGAAGDELQLQHGGGLFNSAINFLMLVCGQPAEPAA